MKLARSIVFVSSLLIPAYAAAQDCPDGTPDGEVSGDNKCMVCSGGELLSLPERTLCGAERRIQCGNGTVFREECVPTAGDPDVTECGQRTWPSCPGGLVCGDEDVCLAQCSSTADCRTGFECRGDACLPVSPDPDMGAADMGAADMGGASDMGNTPDMGAPDVGEPPDSGRPDLGTGDMGAANTLIEDDDGGCSTASGSSGLGLFAVLLMFVRRRRTR